MENFSCSKGRPPDEGVPDVLMADDVAIEDDCMVNAAENPCGAVEVYTHTGAGDKNADHVDIVTCDQSMAVTGPAINTTQPERLLYVKTEAESENEEEKDPLSYDLAQGNRILMEITSDANKSLNWPFMDPVDTEGMGLNDYHERIKEPMWLRKMKEKMERRMYKTITEIVRDFRLMLENCYRYNGPDHYISKRGQKLEIVFEQKLSLLSRDLREKTSIAATSGKPIEDKIITGTRRRKILTPHDSSDLLNQLRVEEKERERENRKQLVEERRQQQQALIQEMFDWEDKLLEPGGREYLYSMWELPQIGHFLFLTGDVLNTGEVMQWELERSFWVPRQSPVFQVIMTSLLSTPYQRTRLDSKPPMPYKIWDEKLRTRIRNWYKIFNECSRDTKKTHQRLGIEEMFFKVLGLTNPMEKRKFHELTFYQRIWIVKTLCDWCLATQDSMREALEVQPLVEQRQYNLGTDADGNSYIHFPQFCGQDLRIYRVQPVHVPHAERAPKVKEETSIKKSPKKKRPASKKTKPDQVSRLKQISPSKSTPLGNSCVSESETSDQDAPSIKSRRESPGPSRPSSTTSTPTKVRSSRTSAAARDWMPRDCSLLNELNGTRRSSRSKRLTCAPIASGESTPTTANTPIGSRESTPVPTTKMDNVSQSSTATIESASTLRRPRKCRSPKKETESDDSESESESTVMKGNEDSVRDSTKLSECTDSNSSSSLCNEIKAEPGSDAPQALVEACKEASLSVDGTDSRLGTPLSLSSTEETLQWAQGSGDTTQICDIGSKQASVQDSLLNQQAGMTDQVVADDTKSINSTCVILSGSDSNSVNSVPFAVDNVTASLKCDSGKDLLCSTTHDVDSDQRDGDPLCASYASPSTPVAGALSDHSSTTDVPLPIKIEPNSDLPFGDTMWESEKQPELYEGLMIKSDPVPGELMETDPMEPATDQMAVDEVVVKEETEEEIEPEIKFPEVGPFRLMADTVEMLRELTLQFAVPEPIVEKRGKKEKVLRPPPRKQCVSELYERLCYLLKELEPWESRLVAVNKKSRISLRKQVEAFVELIEPEEVEDVWESEESASEDSENNDESDANDGELTEVPIKEEKEPVAIVTESPTKLVLRAQIKTVPPPPLATDKERPHVTADRKRTSTNDPEKSSFGRVRKRKVIPNAYDEPPVNRRKKNSSPSLTPNILQCSRVKSKPVPQPNSIESLRAVLSRAKPIVPPSALPPGMQLLNIGGQNVLLNTNSNPPVILQTSAPLNLNNLTLLAQLSAKAAAGNTLGSKIVVKNIPATSTSSSLVVPSPSVVENSRTGPPKQVIRTLLAAGHAPQYPKARTLQPTQSSKSVPSTQLASSTQNTKPTLSVQQITTLTQSMPVVAATNSSTITTMVTGDLPPTTLPTRVMGQSLLQPPSGTDGTRPQFYKYNDLSQMKATIRQQLVKTSQGVRTKSSVSMVPPGSTALSNLIQAGLLPQAPRMTTSMVQPAAPHVAIVPRPLASAVSIPVKSESTALCENVPQPTVSVPIAQTASVASIDTKTPSILSQVLASTGPVPTTTDIPLASPTAQLQMIQQPQSIQSTTQQLPQVNQQLPQVNQTLSSSSSSSQPTHKIVINSALPGSTIQSPPKSTSASATLTILTSPQKSQSTTTHILPKGNLSPELKVAVKKGIINESNIAGLIHANPGLVKALNSMMRPKYASNVTVKSLLESRALRQKAQLNVEGESTSGQQEPDPGTTTPTTKSASADSSIVKVLGRMSIPVQNNKSVAIQIQSVSSAKTVVSSTQSGPEDCNIPGRSPPHMVISAKPEPLAVARTKAVTVLPAVMGECVVASSPSPVVVSKSPIQLHAVRTPQGTILRTISRQPLPARPAGTRIQVGPHGQPVMQLVSPTGVPSGRQLVSPPAPETTPTSSSLDEVIKTVVTSVFCSIPNTPKISVADPFTVLGHQPSRQVTMTTSTMQAPIPSVLPLHAVLPKVVCSLSPTKVTTNSTIADSSAGQASASQTGSKNVVLRVVPQQVMTSQGVVNMVVPQHLIQQALKADGGSGKLVLQTGKRSLQLVHNVDGQTSVVTGSPSPAQTTTAQGHTVLKTVTATGAARTIMTVYPSSANNTKNPVSQPLNTQVPMLATKETVQTKLKLTPGNVTQKSDPRILSKESMVPVDNHQTKTILIQKSQLQQLQQAGARLTSSVKTIPVGQPGVRMVSPQLTLSTAGLVPVHATQPLVQAAQPLVQATQPLLQTSSAVPRPVIVRAAQPQAVVTNASDHEYHRMTSPGFIDDNAMGDVTSSLDLLAAASMLQEAKAPLPHQLMPDNSISLQRQKQAGDMGAQKLNSLQPPTPPAQSQISLYQQQAAVLKHQMKLQQQILEGQQNQQKIIRQLTLQQEVALGEQNAASTLTQTVAPQNVSLVPSSNALVTTTTNMVPPPHGSSTQVASVMATANGRMVQLRFAVPNGISVQQLLQTSQFQQQLTSLKVSAIHGITTSSIPVTTSTSVTMAAPALSAMASPSSHTAAVVSSPASQLNTGEKAVTTATTGMILSSTSPAKLIPTSSGPTRLVAASPMKGQLGSSVVTLQATPGKQVSGATIAGGVTAGLSLPQVAAVSQQDPNNKVMVLVNVNGQLMQAQGLSLGNNMRMVPSVVGSRGNVTVAHSTVANPKPVYTVPAGAKTFQISNSSPPYQRLITPSQQIISSPQKMTIQTTPQKAVNPHMVVARAAGSGLLSPVRLQQGMTLQGTTKANLLSQMTTPLSSNAITIVSSANTATAQNVILRNGK